MNSTFTATAARALVAATRKITALLGLLIATGIGLAPGNVYATTDWQFQSPKGEQYSRLEITAKSLFADIFGSVQKRESFTADLYKKIDLFKDKYDIPAFRSSAGGNEQRSWENSRYKLNYMQHGPDKWLQDKFGHSWNGKGKGHYKGKHGDKDSPVVPIPAAVWLFGSALGGLLAFRRFGNASEAGSLR